MMTPHNVMKELCCCCLKSIRIGQAVTECSNCNNIIHTRCFKISDFRTINYLFYCGNCKDEIAIRYNPFKLIEQSRDNDNEDDDDYEYDEIATVSNILENCTAFTIAEFNNLESDMFKENISTFFLNIDGNQSNFDNLLIELHKYEHKFSRECVGLKSVSTGRRGT